MRLRSFLASTLVLAALGCAGAAPAPQTPPAAPTGAPGAELFEEGRRATERGDSVRAEQYLTLAVQNGYPREKALPLLLRACLEGSRLRAALDHAEAYLREHPEHRRLRYLVATLYVSLGQRDQAELELEQLLAEHPRDPDAHYLSGVLAADSDDQRAREHFITYLDLTPRGDRAAEVRSRLSELAIKAGRREDALP
jgi:tetratricopeptide (TPR) repeat protein